MRVMAPFGDPGLDDYVCFSHQPKALVNECPENDGFGTGGWDENLHDFLPP